MSVPCYQWPGFGLEAKFYGLGLKTCGLGIEGPGLESCTDNYTSRERKIIDDSHNNKLVIIYVQLIINAYLRKSSQNSVHYSSCQDICISSVVQWPYAGSLGLGLATYGLGPGLGVGGWTYGLGVEGWTYGLGPGLGVDG